MENKVYLTELERLMLIGTEKGQSYKELAQIPGYVCCVGSVTYRLKQVAKKLGAANRYEAADHARKQGLLDAPAVLSGNDGGAMKKFGKPDEEVYSKPTMCLHCHLIVEMTHAADTDPVKGAWECPRCGHKYPFVDWKIRKQGKRKKAPA